MVALYVFSLVLGGGLLGLSLLGDIFGGHDVDMSADTSFDVGGDADLSLDAHFDADTHFDTDSDLGGELAEAGAGDAGHLSNAGAHAASKIFSIRTITYSLFGFGSVGASLTFLFHASSALLTAGFAVTGGLLAGTLVNVAFGWVKRSESGILQGEDALAGHPGRVVLPISETGGRVVVEFEGRTVQLRALPHESALDQGESSHWTSVVVVEMKNGVARVAPVSQDLLGG